MLAARTELKNLNGELYRLGYGGHELQVSIRPREPEYARRAKKLQEIYAKCASPLPGLPVREVS
jgi:hypothetical protein